jgi:hypothetical protein
MARDVIDVPTLLHLVTNGAKVSRQHQLVAPDLIRSQALSLFVYAVRDGELTEEIASTSQRLTELKMRLLGDRVSRRTAWRIARDHGWETTFDGEHLAVTKLQADGLVTIDFRPSQKGQGRRSSGAVSPLTAD